MTKSTLHKKDVEHLAKLANLQLSEKEIETFAEQLTQTLSYVENLNELDTKDVKPTDHTTNQVNIYFEDGAENTRQFSQEEALKNAKATKNGYFVVSRIMEE